ncbi:MAG: hypothetical protein Q4G14_04335 [Paracoccus sp. (in: a-proteobacteria)]|uniref:ankyrin repeat domain-containing protein n=1 Tax=Paracoccus sp. TaxID=267 RepID=UPI0026DF39DF|nr:ankyrin repeat domain-containing protein [Paracoccus sp. (in: a-proteobacteria)]MDO5612458.1 hypothetical protein [Paracoccus sp. (in: a-proteobacteria)]
MTDWFQEIRTNKSLNLQGIKNPSQISDDNHTLLQEAIVWAPQYAIALMELGTPLDHQDNNGQTALQYAISRDYEDIATAIIQSGGDVNISDRYGNAALWTAVMQPNPNYNIIKSILHHGGDASKVNTSGKTPIIMAKIKGDEEMIQILNG